MYLNRKVYKGNTPILFMTEEIICECGIKVTGTSKKHLESNLKIHKESKIHKELMENKNDD